MNPSEEPNNALKKKNNIIIIITPIVIFGVNCFNKIGSFKIEEKVKLFVVVFTLLFSIIETFVNLFLLANVGSSIDDDEISFAFSIVVGELGLEGKWEGNILM